MKKIDFKSGIKFECQGSGNCCVSRDSYGYVYLSLNDINKLAKNFKLSIENFKLKYCQTTDGFIHLTEKKKLKGKCIFLDNYKCTVYNSRPIQCRTWPFWNENMNYKTWNNDISKNCPGIGKGKLYSYKEIKNIIEKDKKNDELVIKSNISLQK